MIFDTSKAIILEDERVRLEPLSEQHLPQLLAYVAKQPELWKYAVWPPDTPEAMTHYLQHALTKKSEGDSYPFAVWDKQTNTFAGTTRFYDINCEQQRLQLGYTWYGKQFHGTGLNTHCKHLLLQHVFETLQAERLEFRADAKNKRSIAAMRGIGAKIEGILRAHVACYYGRRDVIVLSILLQEWPKVKSHIEQKLSNYA